MSNSDSETSTGMCDIILLKQSMPEMVPDWGESTRILGIFYIDT